MKKMKTPMQELIDRLDNIKPTEFCSIETIKGWAESSLKKERDVMCQLAEQYFISLGYKSAEDYFDKVFEIKEK